MPHQMIDNIADTGIPVLFRSYSRWDEDFQCRESMEEMRDRAIRGLVDLGNLSPAEIELLHTTITRLHQFPSGRWLFQGGTAYSLEPENYTGSYNCTSVTPDSLDAIALNMKLAMTGCGTGSVNEWKYIKQLPPVRNKFHIETSGEFNFMKGYKDTIYQLKILPDGSKGVLIAVGDSRQGWVDAFRYLLAFYTEPDFPYSSIEINLSQVRRAGIRLSQFGGVSNPIELPDMFHRLGRLLNEIADREDPSFTPEDVCLLNDIPGRAIVAGNIRRKAGMQQFPDDYPLLKNYLWQPGADGVWRIDPERAPLEMSNHTRIFHRKPSLTEIEQSVESQFYTGEGAIQFAPEAIARSNADILTTGTLKDAFIDVYCSNGKETAKKLLYGWSIEELSSEELEHRMSRYGLNACAEILGNNFLCNLAEFNLNMINPWDFTDQHKAVSAAALEVSVLLHHKFPNKRLQKSREYDPIVAACPTGLFDFFVNLFGADYLSWWQCDRPEEWDCDESQWRDRLLPLCDVFEIDTDFIENNPNLDGVIYKEIEREFLNWWREIVQETVTDYCNRNGLKVPNRYTAVQPSGTKALLTGASPGWHPPKGSHMIRRITFEREHPVALALKDYGYNVIPNTDSKHEDGTILPEDAIYHPRCQSWLVEIPVKASWADLPGADEYMPDQFSVFAQWDFFLQVQNYYTTHNTSATLELREHEIKPFAKCLYDSIQNNEGYVSSALMARFDAYQAFPRLPFQPISKNEYEEAMANVLDRRTSNDFYALLAKYDQGAEDSPNACDSSKCGV